MENLNPTQTFKIYVNPADKPLEVKPLRQPRLFKLDGTPRKQKPKNFPHLIALLISNELKARLDLEPDQSKAIRTILNKHYCIQNG